jgi:hypothetical protein
VSSLAGLFFLSLAMWTFWKLFAPCFRKKPIPSQYQLPSIDHKPVYPTYADQQHFYPSPGPTSEVGPSDSVSMAGGIAQPAPTLVSDIRYPARWG